MPFAGSERIALYTHLRAFEGDFDSAQSQLRTVTSAWTAAVLGAIGYLTVSLASHGSKTENTVPLEFFAYMRQAICLVGGLGIFAFWYVDQRIYQRLLHSVYAYGLYLEFKNPDLPQLRSTTYRANLDVTYGLSVFYRVQFWALVILAWVLVVVDARTMSAPPVVGSVVIAAVFTVVAVILNKRSYEWRSLYDVIGELFPDLADALPRVPQSNADSGWLRRIRAHPMPPAPPVPAAEH